MEIGVDRGTPSDIIREVLKRRADQLTVGQRRTLEDVYLDCQRYEVEHPDRGVLPERARRKITGLIVGQNFRDSGIEGLLRSPRRLP